MIETTADRRLAPTLAEPRSTASPISRGTAIINQIATAPLAAVTCGLVLLAAAFVNPLDVEFHQVGSTHSVGLDWQVALKLWVCGIAGGVGAIGFLTIPPVRECLLRPPGLLFTLLGLVFVATSLVAFEEVAYVCRTAALISCAFFLFIPTTLAVLRLRTIAAMVLTGLTIHLVVSWLLYLFVPSIGVFEEELSGNILVPRMAGTAHPNSVGRVGVLSIVISIAMLRAKKMESIGGFAKVLIIALIVLGVATAIETKSRTAIAAGIAATAIMFLDRLFTRPGVILCLLGAFAVGATLFGFGLLSDYDQLTQMIVSSGTKTGDASELTSVTGRTVIWAEAIELIRQRPLTGWGLNGAPILLVEYSQQTHNLLLHVIFSAGIAAGLIMVGLIGWTAFVCLTSVEPLVRGITAYVLVSGLFENTVLETFPFASTLMWLVVLFAPFFYSNGRGDLSAAVESGGSGESGPRPDTEIDALPTKLATQRS